MTDLKLISSTEYFTTNTALAAYLQSEGFVPDIDNSNPNRCIFIFENSDPILTKCIRDFETGKAIGNIATFFYCYKRILSKIRMAGS